MTARSRRDLRYLSTSTSLFAYAKSLQPDVNAAHRLVHEVLLDAFATPSGPSDADDDRLALERAVLAKFRRDARAPSPFSEGRSHGQPR